MAIDPDAVKAAVETVRVELVAPMRAEIDALNAQVVAQASRIAALTDKVAYLDRLTGAA